MQTFKRTLVNTLLLLFSNTLWAQNSLFFSAGTNSIPIAQIAHVEAGSTLGADITTGSVNTTGANTLIVSASWYSAVTTDVTISDSKSNTWVPLTKKTPNTNINNQLFYVLSAVVGSGHTFTCAGLTTYCSIGALAFSNVKTSSGFDVENGATGTTVTTKQPGSITPSLNNEVVISGVGTDAGTTQTINSSMTAYTIDYSSGNHVSGGIAYIIQTTLGALNPAWSWTGSSTVATTIASFKNN